MDVDIRFEGINHSGEKVVGHLLTNKLATYIITEPNPHECTQYGYIEIDQYQRVEPNTVKIKCEK